MLEACHEMYNGEILNKGREDFPLYNATLYGDRILTAKFSKRLSCAIKHLALRVAFTYEYSIEKAVEMGIAKDPTLMLNGEIFLEGLVQAEEITQKFQNLMLDENSPHE